MEISVGGIDREVPALLQDSFLEKLNAHAK